MSICEMIWNRRALFSPQRMNREKPLSAKLDSQRRLWTSAASGLKSSEIAPLLTQPQGRRLCTPWCEIPFIKSHKPIRGDAASRAFQTNGVSCLARPQQDAMKGVV